MLCEKCKEREASVQYTQIVNGVKKEMMLCEKCSMELGSTFNIPISFSNYLGDFISEYNDSFLPIYQKQTEVKCDKCNMTYSEFLNDGKFGCDRCYEVFEPNIDSIFKRLHGSNRHIGRKKYKKIDYKENNRVEKVEENKTDNKLEKLKNKIKKLIREEKYEEAAKVRDEIRKLEKKDKEV